MVRAKVFYLCVAVSIDLSFERFVCTKSMRFLLYSNYLSPPGRIINEVNRVAVAANRCRGCWAPYVGMNVFSILFGSVGCLFREWEAMWLCLSTCIAKRCIGCVLYLNPSTLLGRDCVFHCCVVYMTEDTMGLVQGEF